MRWTARPISDPGVVSQLTAEVTKDPLLAALLVQRGITTFEDAKAFFRPDLNLLHHPYRMKDMERAVERIEKARIQQEHVMIFDAVFVDGREEVMHELWRQTFSISFFGALFHEFQPALHLENTGAFLFFDDGNLLG